MKTKVKIDYDDAFSTFIICCVYPALMVGIFYWVFTFFIPYPATKPDVSASAVSSCKVGTFNNRLCDPGH